MRAGVRTIVKATGAEWQLPFRSATPVPFRKHIPVRRRIMEGMLVATSLVLLWLIILAIDERAGKQVPQAVQTSVSRNGGATTEISNTPRTSPAPRGSCRLSMDRS